MARLDRGSMTGVKRTPRDRGKLTFPSKPTKIISVISNKGGVGKSHFAINISYALSMTNKKVLLVDSDLGSGTTGVKFGLFPKYVLKDFFSGKKGFGELVVPTHFPLLDFIGGSAGDFDLANMNYARKKKFIQSYINLAKKGMYDLMVLDLGASIEKKVMDFALSSHKVIIITTPQDVISGYGCLKGSFIRFIQLASKGGVDRSDKKVFRPLLVVNQSRSNGQGRIVFNVMANLIRESTQEILFELGQPENVFKIEPRYLGEIPYVRDTLIRAEMARKPVMEMFPRSGATLAYKSLAATLLKELSGVRHSDLKPDFLDQWAGDEAEDFYLSMGAAKVDVPH